MNSEVRPPFEKLPDSGRLGRSQITLVVLCALVVVADGFDTQSISVAAPSIATSWHVSSAAFGPIFSIGLIGALLGALVGGFTTDRFGRKPNLLLAIVVFAIASLLTPLTTSMPALIAARLVTGFGLGGALPAAVAITAESTPAKVRATVVGLMFCGFPLGAVIAGIASVRLLPAVGWHSLFLIGGIAPLPLIPLLAWRLRDSARLTTAGTSTAGAPTGPPRASVRSLFTEGRAAGTLLLWATFFQSQLLTYLLASWVPLLARRAGIPATSATLGLVAMNVGAIAGCLAVGRVADRTRSAGAVAAAFALGALAIAGIGQSGRSGGLLLLTGLLAGVLSLGAQMCTVGLCARFYETALRATGVGWTSGIGRIGAITGPALGGVFIAAGISTSTLFLVTAIPSLGAAATVFALNRRGHGTAPEPDAISGLAPIVAESQEGYGH
jgi:AAHS family 4-hydroxybenzoate transporter-like MFS transporter